MSQIYTKK